MQQGTKRSWLRCAVGCLLAGLCCMPSFAARHDHVPDWVREAAKEALPPYSVTTNAVILLEDTTCTVQPDGKAVEHYREVILILRPQGRSYANLGTYFDSDSKLNYLHIWSIAPDGHEYALRDSDITEKAAGAGYELYSDERYKGATAMAADSGAVVALEYEQKVRPYVTEYDWDVQEHLPKHVARFTLVLPPGWKYRAFWKNHAALNPVSTGANTWQWNLSDTPGVDLKDVPLAPSAASLESQLVVHYFNPGLQQATPGDWKSVGASYQQLAEGRALATPEIAAKAQALVAGKTDFADKAEAIADFVQQQIRYVAIEIGIGGWQPHPAADIFQNRYGDCKDKSTLLAAMLSSVGIHSTWVLVDTNRGYVSPDAPSIDGNHAIAAIELPPGYESAKLHSVVTAKSGKRFLIFDPTNEYVPFGQLPPYLQGGYGTLVDGQQSQVIALPVLAPDQNLIERVAHFQLQPDGTLTGQVTEKRYGYLAEPTRATFLFYDTKDQHEKVEHLLQQDFADFTMTSLKAENVRSLDKDIVLQYGVKADGYAKSMGPLLLVRPRVLGSDSLGLDSKARKYPINLDQTMLEKDEYDVQLPAGYKVDGLPDPVNVDMGFASYESRSVVDGNTLHYTRTYTVRQIQLPADKYGDLQKLMGYIEADEHNRVVLKKAE
ncbi:MAG: DUF3857 domain-containing transglutaminase family protein [Acidobacteriaceae bacterium]